MLFIGLVTLGFGLGHFPALSIPALRTYPLPPSLAALPDRPGETYRQQIEPGPQGHWLWTQFPITIWIDPGPGADPRRRAWVSAAEAAIVDWSPYLPLKRLDRPEANIWILRQRPPLRRRNGYIERARHAETRPELLAGASGLQLRQRIYLGDNQGPQQLRGTARHELGHALGLWGHSPNPQDVMYASQTANPVPISERDRQTLRWVYQQPTGFGPRSLSGEGPLSAPISPAPISPASSPAIAPDRPRP